MIVNLTIFSLKFTLCLECLKVLCYPDIDNHTQSDGLLQLVWFLGNSLKTT